jgi:hypothetical protein
MIDYKERYINVLFRLYSNLLPGLKEKDGKYTLAHVIRLIDSLLRVEEHAGMCTLDTVKDMIKGVTIHKEDSK